MKMVLKLKWVNNITNISDLWRWLFFMCLLKQHFPNLWPNSARENAIILEWTHERLASIGCIRTLSTCTTGVRFFLYVPTYGQPHTWICSASSTLTILWHMLTTHFTTETCSKCATNCTEPDLTTEFKFTEWASKREHSCVDWFVII
jgi:hypothetical protein